MKLNTNSVVRAHLRGTLYALAITFAAVLLFALAVQFAGISNTVIGPTTQAIKAISIFIGVLTALRTVEKRAWMHGGILGLIYTVFTFFILSIIDPTFSITSGLIVELVFAGCIGLVSAMLLRLRKREV